MHEWIRTILARISMHEWGVILFGSTFVCGIWYALPMVNNVTDVWPFGGGVLRAIEAHTLLPGYGVAYGTLTFYQNYILMIGALALGYVATGFDAEALKTILVLNPSYSLIVPRVASVGTAMISLYVVYRFLYREVSDQYWRFALVILAFGNVLTTILVRSGKMWMLSMFFGLVSFIYLYRALTEERAGGGLPGRNAAISIVAAFLAAANFAFAGIFLVTIPILLYMFPRTYSAIRRIGSITLAGSVAFVVIFLLNAQNTIAQVSGFVMQFFAPGSGHVTSVSQGLTLTESFRVNLRQGIESFPLLLIALIPAIKAGIRNRLLAALSLIYIGIYIVAVSVIFRSDDGLALNVRHVFPVAFFLMFLLAAYRAPARRISIVLSVVGLGIYIYTLILLSIPTTYNAAYDFISMRYRDEQIRIDERIFELTLPMNKASYALFAPAGCGSTCAHMMRRSEDIPFAPIVTTAESDPIAVAALPPADLVLTERAVDACVPVARFGNDVPDEEVFDIDINLGRMLLPSFYELGRLGKNIYIYDAVDCPGAHAMSGVRYDNR